MKCPQCGQETNDVVCSCGYRFPTVPASPAPQKRFCSNCGAEVTGKFCAKCGKPVAQQPAYRAPQNSAQYASQSSASKISDGDPSKNGVAVAGFVLSLMSFIFSALIVPIITAVIGLILSVNGRKSEKKKLATAGVVLGVLAIIAVFGFANSAGKDDTPDSSTRSVSSSSSSATVKSKSSANLSSSSKSVAASASPSKSSKQEEKIAGLGDTVEYDGLKFTLDSVTEYIDTSEYATDKPDAGNIFIMLNFTVSNDSGEDKHINMFYEDSYCDDVSIDPHPILFNAPGDTIWGDIASGKKRKGYVVYQVPSNWDTLEFQYQVVSIFSSSEKAVFKVSSSDVT